MAKKNTIRLTESELKQVINESVKQIISELDYKTNLNAANKLLQLANDETDPKKKKELWDRAWELGKYANEKFHDEYIGNYRYDTMGDKLKGKKSAKFDAHLSPSSGKMAYGNIRGWNKGGNEIFSTGKGKYYNHQGYVSPRQHFRDAEIADAYSRANDELWDFENGNYIYTKGRGWHLKDDE
jgi:hypothetical protein